MKYLIKKVDECNLNKLNDYYLNKPNNNYLLKNNKKSIIGYTLLNYLLNKNNIDTNKIDYFYNANGKPFIKDINIFFNISHSYDYVITVISKKEIGIDMEKIRETDINTIKYFATDKEKEYILKDKNDIYKRLFQIYTLKEAYIKMLGSNIDDFKDVEFEINNDIITCNKKDIKACFIDDIDGYIISCLEKNI